MWPRGESLDRGAAELEQPTTFVAGFRYLEQESLVNPQRISYLGFSAGASEVFVAATDQRIARRVHTVIFLGGYYDLPAYLVSVATHQVKVGGREAAWNPSPAFIAELKTTLRYSHQGSLLKLFGAKTATAATQLLQRTDLHERDLLQRLSPSSHVHSFRSTIFILHDKGDPIVPWVESRKLAQAMPRKAVHAILWSNVFRLWYRAPKIGDACRWSTPSCTALSATSWYISK
jgi:dipeptidyl aminopeptidase/acylaminoacyl peptidase